MLKLLLLFSVGLYATTININDVNINGMNCTLKKSNLPCSGEVKKIYKNNNTKQILPFKNGVLNGEFKSYYKNGNKKTVVNYINGKREGLLKGWHKNKKLSLKENYKNEKKYGYSQEWYDNAQLRYKALYKDGKVEGIVSVFDKNGTILYKSEYKNGKKIRDIIKKDIDLKLLSSKSTVMYGNGEKVFYIFASLSCPHCKKLLNKVKNFKNLATFYIIFVPLSGSKNSYDKLRCLYNSSLNMKEKMLFDDRVKCTSKNMTDIQKKKINLNIIEAQKLQVTLGISSVPKVLDSKGRMITIKKMLKELNAK